MKFDGATTLVPTLKFPAPTLFLLSTLLGASSTGFASLPIRRARPSLRRLLPNRSQAQYAGLAGDSALTVELITPLATHSTHVHLRL